MEVYLYTHIVFSIVSIIVCTIIPIWCKYIRKDERWDDFPGLGIVAMFLMSLINLTYVLQIFLFFSERIKSFNYYNKNK